MASNTLIGALRVDLGLNTSEFKKGMKNADDALGALTRKLAVAAAAATAALGAGLAALTKSSLKFVDAQAKMARQLDGSIDGLRALQLAAADAGVQGLEQNVQKLTQRIAEAKDPATAAGKAIAQLGLDANALAALDVDARVAKIADAVKGLGLSAGATGDLMRDLGIRNQDFALLLTQGGDAIRKARQEVADLGLSLSAVDAAKVEAANDAMMRIGLVFEGLGNQLAISLAPALKSFADGLVELSKITGPIGQAIAFLGENIGRLATYAATAAALMGGRFAVAIALAAARTITLSGALGVLRGALIRTGIGALVVAAGEMVYQFSKLIEGAGSFGNAMGLLGDVAAEVWERMGLGAQAFGARVKSVWYAVQSDFLAAVGAMAEKWANFLGIVSSGLAAIPGVGQAAAATLNGLAQSARNLSGTVVQGMRDEATVYAGVAETLTNMATAPLASVGALREAMSGAASETAGAADAAERLSAALDGVDESTGGGGKGGGGGSKLADKAKKTAESVKKDMETLGEAVQKSLEGSIGRAIDSLIDGTFNLRDALRGIFADLAKMAANRLITGLLGKAFGGIKIPGFAEGTSFAPGGLAMVGERGPELVNLPRGSQVIPNDRLAGMAAPAPVVKVANILDPRLVGDFLATPDGEEVIVNVLRARGVLR